MSQKKSKWSDLEIPLNDAILDVVKEYNFKKMTPVQVSIITKLKFSFPMSIIFISIRQQQFHY